MTRNRHPIKVSSDPLVSILTPTFNRPDWLKLTLDSLIGQTYKNWECIVVNDAGINVKNVVDNFNDKRIKYFENPVNLDLADTRNVATEKSLGDWFIMLDDDDQLFPETIEFRLWRAKKLNAEIVYSRVLQCYFERKENQYVYIGEKLYWDSPYDSDLILIQNIAPCNGIMYSRKAMEAGGLFDSELKAGEDWSHSIAMSRVYPFYETKIIDCMCSFRTDNAQMTGRRNFAIDQAKIYKKWRHTAKNLPWVIEHQNNMLKQRGISPEEYGL
jgi:glycosyltransferase involved in cell wall biosynthesis